MEAKTNLRRVLERTTVDETREKIEGANSNAVVSRLGTRSSPIYSFDIVPTATKCKNGLHSEYGAIFENEIRNANTLRHTVNVIRGQQNFHFYSSTAEKHYCKRH